MKQFWIWPIALYLFLGGLGGGMMATAAVVGLIIAPSALTSGALVWGVFIAFLILGIGTGLLVFELGQPWIFYRAFVTRTSVIKWGAVFLSISMIAGVLFIFWELSWLTFLPFIPYEGFAQVLLGIAGIFGLCVTIYTGVLLSSMKSRPFWNTPVLPVLFMVSGCSTGAALLSMCIGVWPFPAEWLQVNLSTPLAALLTEELRHILHVADAILISLELVVLLLYVMLQFCASNETAKAHAERWVRGEWAGYFWGLMVCCGLIIPLLLNVTNVGGYASALIALMGGCLLRFMIIWSYQRRVTPAELKYYTRLPQSHQDFMDYWEAGREYWTWVTPTGDVADEAPADGPDEVYQTSGPNPAMTGAQ